MKTLSKLLLLSVVCEAFMGLPAVAQRSDRGGDSGRGSGSYRASVSQPQVSRAQPAGQVTFRQAAPRQVAQPAFRQPMNLPPRQIANQVTQPPRNFMAPRVAAAQNPAPARVARLPESRPAVNQNTGRAASATNQPSPPVRSGVAQRSAAPPTRSVVLPANRPRVSDTATNVRQPSISRVTDSRPAVVRPGQNSIATRRPDIAGIRSQTAWNSTRLASVNRNFRNSANWNTHCENWGSSPWWNRSCYRPWYGGCWNGNWNSFYYHDYCWYDPWYRGCLLPGYVVYDSYYPVGWGLLGWGLGSMIYDLGYDTYYNPYPASAVVASDGSDVTYTEPLARIAAHSAPADDARIRETTRSSESYVADSQSAFRAHDYLVALELADKAVAESPADGALHEYRALVLFALGRYGEAAGVLNPVIASGPGWDWATMRGLYDSLETYTDQLRRLETYTLDHPTAADSRFLLGYHYMVCGHLDAAATQFESAAQLMPADGVSRQLANLAKFSVKDTGDSLPPGVERTPAAVPATKSLPREIVPLDKLQGTWVATRDTGATITLRFLPDGKFTWTHLKDAKTTELAGAYSINDNGLLVLDSPDSQIVADITLPAERQLKFVLVGGPPADPGLDFKKP